MVKCESCRKRYARRKAMMLNNPAHVIRDRYRAMTRRAKKRGYTELAERAEFIEWSENNLDFHRLYKAWKESGWNTKISPSVNRIDNERQYSMDNIEWITHQENSRDGAKWQQKKKLENRLPMSRKRAA